jgi:riboflavin synthase
VNLERALRAGDRLGGHFVQGHVDGVGTVETTASDETASLVDIRIPPDVAETTVLHGSITIDGVSLTVNAVPRPGVVQVSLVPFTREHTTLGAIAVGDRVHVEADVLGKYVRQLCRSGR